MSASNRETLAYRLAGHIVALAEFGIEVFDAMLDGREETNYLPGIISEDPFWDRDIWPDRCDECFRRCLAEITANLSGLLGESSFDPEYKPESIDID